MSITIHPSIIKGTIDAPSSKSMSQRAIIAAMLKPGLHTITGLGKCNDEIELLTIASQLNALVSNDDDTIIIKKPNVAECIEVLLGESGLSTRLLLPTLSLFAPQVNISGKGSLLNRSMQEWVQIASLIGLETQLTDGRLPISNQGRISPANITLDASASSQFVSGVLLAYASADITETVTVTLENPVSTPYIDMTIAVIESFGLNVPEQHNWTYSFHPKNIVSTDHTYHIEGDWSNAAFLLVAGALSGGLCVTNLDAFTKQGDKAILTALMDASVHLSIEADKVTVRPSKIRAFQFDAVNSPDLFPPLVALAAKAQGTSVISGVHRLYNKESDRAATLIDTFTQLGIEIIIQDDLMVIKGNPTLQWDTHKHIKVVNDHRIVMASTIFALTMNQPLIMVGHEAVNKSYPTFFEDLEKIGAQITRN